MQQMERDKEEKERLDDQKAKRKQQPPQTGATPGATMVRRGTARMQCWNTVGLKRHAGRWLCPIHIPPPCCLKDRCQFVTAQPLAPRDQRTRTRLRKMGNGRPRLSVFRSSKNIYAQIIDDANGVTLVSASTMEKDNKITKSGVEAAAEVGKLVAERAKEKGLTEVVFDRGGYIFHGRVKALADAAREGGLNF